jgi:hypothetical protein
MTREEVVQEIERIADALESALDGDGDRQYAAEQALKDLRVLALDAR